MKKLIVIPKRKRLIELCFPNLDKRDPNYVKHVKKFLEYKEKQPDLYARIIYWD